MLAFQDILSKPRNAFSAIQDLFNKKKRIKANNSLFHLLLPDEVKLHVFSFLTVSELYTLAFVCRDIKILAMDDSLWMKFFVKVASGQGGSLSFPPLPRVCHSAVVYDDKMYIYGGHVPDERNYIRDVNNDFYAYQFATRQWEVVGVADPAEGKGVTMPLKTEHTSVVYKNCMYMFGGYSDSTMGYSDVSVYEYNFDTRVCSRLEARGQPPPDRSAHTAVVYKDCMYVLGGWDGTVSNCDFFSFHFPSRTWATVPTSGPAPPSVRSHASVVYRDRMVVFGGYGENVHPTSVYIFHFPERRWEEINPASYLPASYSPSPLLLNPLPLPSPSPSSSPSPLPLDPPFSSLSLAPPSSSPDAESSAEGSPTTGRRAGGMQHDVPIPASLGPCGRSRFRMVYYNDSLWVVGGWDRKSYFADMWRFRLDTMTWHKVDAAFEFNGVGQHSLVVHHGRMYLYGGYCSDSKAPHPHLYIFRLPKSHADEA